MMTVRRAELLYMRGEFHFVEDKYDEALEDFNKVLEFVKAGGVEKSFWLAEDVFYAIARTYQKRNQPDDRNKALACLNEGIEFLSD